MSKDNCIWITGTSSGIGKSLVLKFNANKKKVIGSARRSLEELEFPGELTASDLFSYFQNDISDPNEVASLYQKIRKDNFIYCLINNAGITSFKPFLKNNVSEIENIIRTNLNGSIYAIKNVLPEMIENRRGIIINILSVASKKVFLNSSLYAASKAGLEAFSKVLREEVRDHNINVVNIYPGATATDIWPEDTIQNLSEKMMSSDDLASFIFDVYQNSYKISPEEIVVRPQAGDL